MSISHARQLHARIIITGQSHHHLSLAKILTSYCQSEPLRPSTSRVLFDSVRSPNVFLWNTIIRAYARSDVPQEALVLLQCMLRRADPSPNAYTLSFVLDACANSGIVAHGRCLHALAVRLGFESNVYVLNALMHSLSRSGELEWARKLFDESPQRDVVSWNIMISSYVHSGRFDEALSNFADMEENGVKGNAVTVVSALSACAQLGRLELGRKIHGYIGTNGIGLNEILQNALIDMYAKCGGMIEARRTFDEMHSKNTITWNSMISGYARAGFIDIARRLFDEMPNRNIISWTSMMTGYVQNEQPGHAISLFRELLLKGIEPDEVMMVSALSACADLGCLDQGKSIHGFLNKRRIHLRCMLGASLIDMYAKSGRVDAALRVFNGLKEKDVNSWTAIITGLALHGQGRACLSMFGSMEQSQIAPNAVTFVGVLCACSHAGLVDDGFRHFSRMRYVYGIEPEIEHFGCMVDLLGRAGHLDEAQDFILKMPIEPTAGIWSALLGACRIHGNFKVAETVARALIDLDPHHGGRYVLLSNIYAAGSKWEDVTKVRKKMKDLKVEKEPGWSWIEVDATVKQFFAGDQTNLQHGEVMLTLEEINRRLQYEGYVPLGYKSPFDIDE
ncbi:Pentatricopeptide repeat-containing protein [Nymphaea thermarum]|nr:Pentatricopeptide repeat-containing protein [Nymphaea thermarum]